MSPRPDALRAILEGLAAQHDAMGAAIEAALALLGDDDDEPVPVPVPPPVELPSPGPAPARPPCPHARTEPAGGFGGHAMTHLCIACGAEVAQKR